MSTTIIFIRKYVIELEKDNEKEKQQNIKSL